MASIKASTFGGFDNARTTFANWTESVLAASQPCTDWLNVDKEEESSLAAMAVARVLDDTSAFSEGGEAEETAVTTLLSVTPA